MLHFSTLLKRAVTTVGELFFPAFEITRRLKRMQMFRVNFKAYIWETKQNENLEVGCYFMQILRGFKKTEPPHGEDNNCVINSVSYVNRHSFSVVCMYFFDYREGLDCPYWFEKK